MHRTDDLLRQIRRHELLAADTRHDAHNRAMSRRIVASLKRELGAASANKIAVAF